MYRRKRITYEDITTENWLRAMKVKRVELEPTELAVPNDHLSNDVFLERQYNAKKNQFIFCKISILQMTTKIRSKTNRRLFMISWRNRY